MPLTPTAKNPRGLIALMLMRTGPVFDAQGAMLSEPGYKFLIGLMTASEGLPATVLSSYTPAEKALVDALGYAKSGVPAVVNRIIYNAISDTVHDDGPTANRRKKFTIPLAKLKAAARV